MRSCVAFLAALCLCQAKPQKFIDGARPSFRMGGEQYIIGGSDAIPGEFPWQLSVTRGGSHCCSASLLSSNSGLGVSHSVDGALPGSITVIAGLHDRSGTPGSQEVNLIGYTMHAEYLTGIYTYSNDIAILHFATPITIGGNIQPATLPADNSNNYDGVTCVISGWGRTGVPNILPDTLQKASIEVIGTAQCQTLVDNVAGCKIWDNHICIFDSAGEVGICNGDSGGPLNCPDGGVTVVAGIISWGISSGAGNCDLTYPSVCTRTSAYLDWIAANAP